MYSLKSMRASPQIIAQRNPKAQKAGGLCLDTPLPSETEKIVLSCLGKRPQVERRLRLEIVL